MYDKLDKISVNIWILQRNTTDLNNNNNNNNNNNLQYVHSYEQQECQPNEFTGTNIWEGSRTQRTEPSHYCLV